MIRKALDSSRPLVVIVAAIAFLAAACGDDNSAADETTTTEAATAEETTTTTAAAEEEVTEDAVEGLPTELGEWFITPPEGLTAGSLTFALMNVGENPHAFAIARGTSYEELPQTENGAVDQEALGEDFIGAAENVAPGESGSVTFDLEAGDYVFFCPIEFGPNSHAAAGQVLSVTVG